MAVSTYSWPLNSPTTIAGYSIPLAMSFTVLQAGTITAVWAWVGGDVSAPVNVALYDSAGTVLSTGTATLSSIANDWVSIPLSPSVAVTANTVYYSAWTNTSPAATSPSSVTPAAVATAQFSPGSYYYNNGESLATLPNLAQGGVAPAPITIQIGTPGDNSIGSQVTYHGQTWTIFCYCGGVTPDQVQYVYLNRGGTFIVVPASAISSTTPPPPPPAPATGTVSVTLGAAANTPNIDGAAQNFNDAGTSVAANLTTTQPNDVIFVCLESGATTTGVSGGGLTWTQIASTTNSGGTICQVYQAIAPTPLANVAISVTYAATTAVWMGVVAVSNANTTSPLDGSVVIQNTKGGALNVTTTLASDLVFAFSNHDIDMSPAPAAGWTAVLGNTNKWALVQCQVVPTASTVNAQGADPLDANGSMAWAVKHA